MPMETPFATSDGASSILEIPIARRPRQSPAAILTIKRAVGCLRPQLLHPGGCRHFLDRCRTVRDAFGPLYGPISIKSAELEIKYNAYSKHPYYIGGDGPLGDVARQLEEGEREP